VRCREEGDEKTVLSGLERGGLFFGLLFLWDIVGRRGERFFGDVRFPHSLTTGEGEKKFLLCTPHRKFRGP
jgi:hypothetical protein